jgi:phosphate transport system substrate-binding protein
MTARRGDAHAMKMRLTTLALCGALAFGVAACGDDEEEPAGSSGGQTQAETGGSEPSAEVDPNLSGTIRIDGSSTVQPFAEAAAELFGEQAPNVKISVGGAGTGDGFERFCRGEIDISNASRAIEEEEVAACKKGKVQYSEVQVANDALAVVTNPDLQFPDNCIKTSDLKKLLAPNSKIKNYSELGSGYPDAPVSFFTPGEESGTFDYFTDEVLETDAEQRTDDVQTSANDSQLITGVEGTEGALAYFGFSFAEQERERLNILAIDAGQGCVEPSVETAQSGEYKPLSRPLFMYPNDEKLKDPAIKAFMDFTIANQQEIAEAAQIVPLTEEQATEATDKLTQAVS